MQKKFEEKDKQYFVVKNRRDGSELRPRTDKLLSR